MPFFMNSNTTKDLLTLTGVLALHFKNALRIADSRVTKETYKEIEGKLNPRLNNWKTSSLFLAKRITLKTIIKPKSAGGLGLKHLKDLNHAYMTKAGWGLIERKDSV
ncbi:hypothetical protein Ahy_B06g080929 [Arachis hypogaea]|uniref:Uncharacterized protein n=1 Tax=Arachis hypogaea TaxID=3818 RepID=A0A444YJJ0_ARAHY|nr:hypothetical protein Ahy_B06g080929 [Arachis hypogaea]